jgi:hypothetical protein
MSYLTKHHEIAPLRHGLGRRRGAGLVSNCAAVVSAGATKGGNTDLIATGVTQTGTLGLANNQIVVKFHKQDATGVVQLRDTDFHLIVAC